MITIQVFLHALLQYRTPKGPVSRLKIRLEDGAIVRNVLTSLDMLDQAENLILSINHRVVDETARLEDGDRLDVIPSEANV